MRDDVTNQIQAYPNPCGRKRITCSAFYEVARNRYMLAFGEFQGIVNPQGYHLRNPKNCPTPWGHLSRVGASDPTRADISDAVRGARRSSRASGIPALHGT